MKVKKIIFWLAIALICLGVRAEQEKINNPKSPAKERLSFIKKELIPKGREFINPWRNIFIPYGSNAARKNMKEIPSSASGVLGSSQHKIAEVSPDMGLNLKYVGYVVSGEKIMALVIFQGQARAVGKDEMLSEEFRVKRVTKEEIEIFGPGSKTIIFTLEGERP